MNRREQLQERYEDAVFALLMDKIATKEGERANAENERLMNDSSATIPEDVDKRCLQTIRRHFARQRAHAAGRFTLKTVKYVMMAAGLAAFLFVGAFAASENVRVNTMNLVVKVFETNTTFQFVEQPSEAIPQISVGWLPEGYILKTQGKSDVGIWNEYQNSEGGFISVIYTATSGLTANIDTEDAEIEYIEVNGTEAILIKKEIGLQLVWTAKDNSIFIRVLSTEKNLDNLISIANSIQI